MDSMIPEILYIICSYLEIEDVRRFRLCCRAFADAAACFVHREVIFYLHETDLEMLRCISLHPIASKNVRSLVYIGHTLGPDKQSIEAFCQDYELIRMADKVAAEQSNEPLPPRLSDHQLLEFYKRYEHAFEQEQKVVGNNEDISCIKEVVSRFTALQELVMSNGFWFRKGLTKTPFEGIIARPGSHLMPEGCRQLDSVLNAVFESNIKLKKLTAGELSWQFFQRPPAELKRTMPFYSDLTCLQLCIDVGMIESNAGPGTLWDITTGTEVPQCRQLLKTGLLRDFIKSLTQLQTLYVVFNWHSEEHGYAASLEDIMEPKHTWEHLESLTLGNITCERQDLMSMLKRHKNTLEDLCLRDVRLRSTSWQVLLPKIRKTMNLYDACICGEVRGQRESPPHEEEFWNLEMPDEFEEPLRDDVNDYLVKDASITRCPLNRYNGEF
ncbi:uncharacterized protein GGS22DRAFT_138997 [Annulohypoxylon maeteangense]|uniref:uncharacterized protein n=1 Tax=Annulohypoxylon maeteangense TaxID=1927788 RepID=UPI002007B12F|nr:uncharacterized protein GGS22DRAFT_138997 [Annulohypoxylon maeteangense]KAI0885110.1 hypothetical protein GGS22DRAFT_138997 [Annulohypoxylon maeteangense]